MFTVTYTHSRPSWETKFFYDASDEAKQMIDEIDALARQSPGFISTDVSMSPDGNVNTIVVTWKSSTAFSKFEADNKEFLDDYRVARIVYDALKGTKTTKVFQGTTGA